MKTNNPRCQCGARVVWLLLAMALQQPRSLCAEAVPPAPREPDRQELWVPSDQLDAVLKQYPKAVMLTPQQYEVLIRDAGKVRPTDAVDPGAPDQLIIESLVLRGKAEAGKARVSLQGELTVRASRQGWMMGSISWPLSLRSLSAEGGSLLAMLGQETDRDGVVVRPLILYARGPGVMKLRFETEVAQVGSQSTGETLVEIPDVLCAGRVELEVPQNAVVLGGSASMRVGNGVTAAFDHLAVRETLSPLPDKAARAARIYFGQGNEAARVVASSEVDAVEAEIEIAETGVSTRVRLPLKVAGGSGREVELRWPLADAEVQVTEVTGNHVQAWRQEGDQLILRMQRSSGATLVNLALRRPSAADWTQSNAVELAVPLVKTGAPILIAGTVQMSADLEMLAVSGAKQIEGGKLRFQLSAAEPKITVRTSKPRLEAVVDGLISVHRSDVQIDRLVMLQADRVLNEARLTLPEGEDLVTLTSQTSPMAKWKRVGQRVELRWEQPLPANMGSRLQIQTRKKLANAGAAATRAEQVVVENLQLTEAVKVSGYTALTFDDGWRVRLGAVAGLEDRDVKLSPVSGGRMAWFGLRDWRLPFEVERAEAVYSAVITAYALPRARTVEIEGQVALEISGAPLRQFQIKLPIEVAKLLRVTSPLVGEQKLDDATGVWTCTLIKESTGTQNIRFRLSLPAEVAGGDGETEVKTVTASLPRMEMPEARRFRGTWVVEANTDTQLSFESVSLQPLDVLRVPAIQGYAARHRVVAAYTYGTGEHALHLTARRHAHSELAAMIVTELNMSAVLGRDGHSLHEASLALQHSGEQFISMHLPQGAEVLSATVNGVAVKPVHGADNAIAIPMPSGSENAPNTGVKVQYELIGKPWTGGGSMELQPIRLPGSVPVLRTSWSIHAPDGYTYTSPQTGLQASGFDATESLWDLFWNSLANVGPNLQLAASQLELGQFDIAEESFKQVLQADTHNVAARRGLEELERHRSGNFGPGRDFSRGPTLGRANQESDNITLNLAQSLSAKMDRIIFPQVQFSGASVEEAIEFLRLKSRDLDVGESDPAARGVNLILRTGDTPSTAQISLDLKDVPMKEALRYVTELAGMKFKVEANGVLIVPISETNTEMVQRVFQVPPDFLVQDYPSAGSPPADQFATTTSTPVDPVRRATAIDVLKNQGIPFPEGATAEFDPVTSRLIITSTQPNLDLVEAFVGGGTLYNSVDELAFSKRAGLLPITLDLPQQGRLLSLSGDQDAEAVIVHYVSWETQMLRAMAGLALGLVLFYGFGRGRWFLKTVLLLVLACFGAPLVLTGGWLALVNAVLVGWFAGLCLAAIYWCLARPRVEQHARIAVPAVVSSWIVLLTIAGVATPSHSEEPDPAKHLVIVPYPRGKLPGAQTATRYYLPYETFERLWKTAKENRRPLPLLPEDRKQDVTIHSAAYDGRTDEQGIQFHATVDVVSRGDWVELPLAMSGVIPPAGKGEAVKINGLIGSATLDGRSVAIQDGKVWVEKPGSHRLAFDVSLPVGADWRGIRLNFPMGVAGTLRLTMPRSDGWLWADGQPAEMQPDAADGRVFSQALAAGQSVMLERTRGGQHLGEGPVAMASTSTALIWRDLHPLDVIVQTRFEFPGTVRRTLTWDAPQGLRSGAVTVKAMVGDVMREIPVAKIERTATGDRLTLACEVVDAAEIEWRGEQSLDAGDAEAAIKARAPVIKPESRRSTEQVSFYTDGSREIKVDAAGAQRLSAAAVERDALVSAGVYQARSAAPIAFELMAVAEFESAETNIVFQISEQKCEMVAMVSLKRKLGQWVHAAIDLPSGYEVQSVASPALQGWARDGDRLHLRLNPAEASQDARIGIHLARSAEKAATSWKLEPLKPLNFEKVSGRAMVAAHAAMEVRLADDAARSDVRELDATVPDPILEPLFNIAPPFVKKRAVSFEGTAWTVEVTMAREAARFAADAVTLVRVSDDGIRLSQQVGVSMEQGAVKSVTVRLPASLPEAVVSGPALREVRTSVKDGERLYECAFQSDVLGSEALTFDHDLPLTPTLSVPFVKVDGVARLQRFFVTDNRSSRESRVTESTGLEPTTRQVVPYLPGDLALPQFFRAPAEGKLEMAYDELTATEANAATITLAALTTVLRTDGTRWEMADYSLNNRSLQFLPVMLPEGAELISASVSGTPVRADERTEDGKRLRLIPLIHTQIGQRALEVRLVYRFAKKAKGAWDRVRLDDPEVPGLSIERTTWSVWSPQGSVVSMQDGNMDAASEGELEDERKLAALSMIGQINQQVAGRKLDTQSAAAALDSVDRWLGDLGREGEGDSRRAEVPASRRKVAEELKKQGQMLSQNRVQSPIVADKNSPAAESAESGERQGTTRWDNNAVALEKGKKRDSGATNTFSGDLAVGQNAVAFNDNVVVSQGFFAQGEKDAKPAQLAQNLITANGRGNNVAQGGRMQVQPDTTSAQASNSGVLAGAAVTLNSSGSTTLMQGTGGVPVELMNANGFEGSTFAFNGGALMKNGEMPPSNTTASEMGGGFAAAATSTVTGVPTPVGDKSAELRLSGVNTYSGGAVVLGGTLAKAEPIDGGISATPMEAVAAAAGAPAAPAPAMAADPFGSPAGPTPKPGGLAATADREVAGRVRTMSPEAKAALPAVSYAQQVESLRPTGRRALPIELPTTGVVTHFVKLKDHANLQLKLTATMDPAKRQRALYFVGGLLLCGILSRVGRRKVSAGLIPQH